MGKKYPTIKIRIPIEDVEDGTWERMRLFFHRKPVSMSGTAYQGLKKQWREWESRGFNDGASLHEPPS